MPADLNAFELWLTVAALIAGAGLAFLMGWLERRPRRSLTPGLVPTTPVMFIGAVIAVFALVHLINLLGVKTGR